MEMVEDYTVDTWRLHQQQTELEDEQLGSKEEGN